MKLINITDKPDGLLYSWLPSTLIAERVIFLPDACPGKSPLPTGTVVLTAQDDWRRFAVSDCGCGMRLLKSSISADELSIEIWDAIADRIRANKGGLGDLGGGNHFLDALLPYDASDVYFLIHTGSRLESKAVEGLVSSPAAFDAKFAEVVEWAECNRAAVQGAIEEIGGPLELVMDRPHNTYEQTADGVIIRKGAVQLNPGEVTVIPSHMSGDVSLVRAKDTIDDLLTSMSHGTGRMVSRGEAKKLARSFDFKALRKNVMLPTSLQDSSLTTEGPFAYRELDDCLSLLSEYVDEVTRYSVIAYMGHL